jgi:hypothetical protein
MLFAPVPIRTLPARFAVNSPERHAAFGALLARWRCASPMRRIRNVRGFNVDAVDFVEFLSSTPCTRDVAQDYLQRGFNVRLPKTSYNRMWERLEEQLGALPDIGRVCETTEF